MMFAMMAGVWMFCAMATIFKVDKRHRLFGPNSGTTEAMEMVFIFGVWPLIWLVRGIQLVVRGGLKWMD